MELKIAARQCSDDSGRSHRFQYFLTVEETQVQNLCLENYGVRIAEEGGQDCALSGLTTSASRIDELLTLLVDNLVGPAGLRDVVEDWL